MTPAKYLILLPARTAKNVSSSQTDIYASLGSRFAKNPRCGEFYKPKITSLLEIT
jgi:hypothetical protein